MIKYRCTCLKEIYWDGKTLRPGNVIDVSQQDMKILTRANVVVFMEEIREPEIETTMFTPPENRATQARKGGRK